MSVFNIKAGERVSITTEGIHLVFEDYRAKAVLKPGLLTYYATATDTYREINGERNRLFVDMSIDTGAGREIWLTDGPTVIRGADGEILKVIDPPVLEEWPDVLGETDEN